MTRKMRLLMSLLIGAVVLSGCEFDVYKLPLPGGSSVGKDPITVTVEFADVLDLVPKSSVKVNDVTVGQVSDINLTGFTAMVTLKLRNDTALPANAVAQIRQTSLLGEKFVSLGPPTAEAPEGTLANGADIPLDRSGRNPEIEEVLGALSLLLNGGGVGQLKTIAQELNLALDGREDSARSVLTQIRLFMSQLDANKGDIVDAIESLNRLAISVKQQQGSIDQALEELPSALDSLGRQRDDLIKMLDALDRLSVVGVRVIDRSKQSTIESLTQLQPVLTQLANSGDALVNSFNVFLTYPFVDEVVGRDPQVARNLHMGDYTNLSVQLDVNLGELGTLPEAPGAPCTPLSAIPEGPPIDLNTLCPGAQDAIAPCLDAPSLKTCADLPAAVIGSVCASLATPIPVLCSAGGGAGAGSGGGGGGGGGLPGVPGLPGGPDLPGGIGGLLGRSAVGTTGPVQVAGHGPTYAQLMTMFDPALVSLLTPGMVLR